MGIPVPSTLDQLAVFTEAAAAGSFSAAARRLGRAQSAVSTAIANLEIDWGVTLFDRDARLPVLTEAGERMLREARAVLSRAQALEGHAQALAGGVEPRLALAIDVPFQPLAGPLAEFAERFPHVDLDLLNPSHGDVAGRVLAGDAALGVALARPGYPRELSFRRVGELPMVHVASPDHPLGHLRRVDFDDLQAHRRLALRGHRATLPTSEYLDAPLCWEGEHYPALVELARAGLGWASVPRALASRELAAGELVELHLTAYPHTEWRPGVDLLWRLADGPGPAATWLRERLAAPALWPVPRGRRPRAGPRI